MKPMTRDIVAKKEDPLNETEPMDVTAPPKKKGAIRENVEAIALAILLALFIRAFIVQAFKIPSGSMKETLQIGDHILVNKFIYGVKLPFLNTTVIPVSEPKRGDIVVFEFPEDKDKDFIKRTIAVGGDVVEVRNKAVYVDGEKQDQPYAVYSDDYLIPGRLKPRDNFGPVTVPEGKLFVMGDNRDHSYDSRFWGFVDLAAVKGKAFMIYWSWDKEDFSVRWRRIGDMLH